jgi:hypothetical protein
MAKSGNKNQMLKWKPDKARIYFPETGKNNAEAVPVRMLLTRR